MRGPGRYETTSQLNYSSNSLMAGVAYHCVVRLLTEEKLMARDLVVFPVFLVILFGKGGVFELGIVVVEVFDVFDNSSGLCVSVVSHIHVFPLASFYYLPQSDPCVWVEYCWSSAVWANVDVWRDLHLICGEKLNVVSHSKLLE
jgi:hypothetical protein